MKGSVRNKSKQELRDQDWMWRSLYGMSSEYKYAGHYKDTPIFTHPDAPEGILYFVNEDIVTKK